VRVALDLDRATVLVGDSRRLGELVPPETVHAIVTDPPCGIGFMGHAWDRDAGGRDAWVEKTASELAPSVAALKPGGHALIWALPRTSHWTALAAERAGLIIRDRVSHLFGTGTPHGRSLSLAVDASDRADERRARNLQFTAWMRSTGISCATINATTSSRMGSHYLTDGEQPEVATGPMFDLLRPLLPPVPPEIEELVRARTVESENLKRRPVERVVTMPDTSQIRLGFAGAAYNGAAVRATREVAVTSAYSEDAKRWEGWNTTLKPACEDWWLCQKPYRGTVADVVRAHRVGGLNVDACRIPTTEAERAKMSAIKNPGSPVFNGPTFTGEAAVRTESFVPHEAGRWPAHVVFSHDDDCTDAACAEGCAVATLDAQSPQASRYFYAAKTPKREKEAGLDALPERPGGVRNHHPTVKSQALMRWLVRLITPPGGIVLDPYAGTGSTAVAALAEGFRFLGCELGGEDEEYVPILLARVTHAHGGGQ